MIQVILPLSFVVRAISMGKEASAMRLVILPGALKNRPVGVNHPTPTIRHVILPVAFIDRAVLPRLHAAAMSFPVGPLALVLTTIWQLDECLLALLDTGVIVFSVELAVFKCGHVFALGEHSVALGLELFW